MPKLKSFDFKVNGSDGMFDVNHLLNFLSQRPVEKLRFIMEGGDVDMFAPLSAESVQALSNMHSLVSLELDICSSWLHEDDVSRLIKPGSWPLLKSLKLIDTCQSVRAFGTVLLAAPALEEIEISSYFNRFSFPLMCIFQMQLCPSLCFISTEHTGYDSQEFDLPLLSGFARTNPMKLNDLKRIRLWCADIDMKVLHLLISKLSLVPIEEFLFPPCDWPHEEDKNDLTAFKLIMQRNLTHLTQVWPGHSGMDSPCVQGMQRTLPDGTLFPFEDIGKSILRFSTARDEYGRNGREAFFHHVYQKLTADEKNKLIAWDEGDYGLE